MDVEVYSVGLCYLSACAPPDMSAEQVEKRVNEIYPTGIKSRWTIAEDELFANSDVKNGGLTTCERGETRHWLLSC